MIGRPEVLAAGEGLAPFIRRTPQVILEAGALGDGSPAVVLKLELLQRSGSFKARGATWQLLRHLDEARSVGVVAASGGNFGIAVADAARELGVRATIFVTSLTSAAKIGRLELLGADVVVVEGAYADALAAASEHPGVALHAYDDDDMLAGNATMASEVVDVDTALLAVGGGGLLGGCLARWQDDVRVVAVETERTPTLHSALAAGAPVDVEIGGRCADSLGARRVGDTPWELVQRWQPESLLVSDDDVLDAQRKLWAACRIYAEPGGATALAAITSGAYVPAREDVTVVVVCGGNGDPADL